MKSVFLRVVHDPEGLRNNYSRICPRGRVGRLPGRPFQKCLFHFTFPISAWLLHSTSFMQCLGCQSS